MKKEMLEKLTRKNTRKNLLALERPQFELIFTDAEKKSFHKTINNRLNYLSLSKRNVDDAGKVHFVVNLKQRKGCLFVVEITEATFENEDDFFQYEIFPYVRRKLVRSRLFDKYHRTYGLNLIFSATSYFSDEYDSLTDRADAAFNRIDRLDADISQNAGCKDDIMRVNQEYGNDCLIIFDCINKLEELIDKTIEKSKGSMPVMDN